MKTIEDKIKHKAQKILDMETRLVILENTLSKNKQFQEFIKLQKTLNETAVSIWDEIFNLMVDNDKRTIDAKWVLLTVVNKKNLEVSDKLSDDFKKQVPDTTKINAYIKEKKRPPKGVKVIDAPYLRKTFRSASS